MRRLQLPTPGAREVTGLLVVVVLAFACGTLAVASVNKSHAEAADAAREAAAYTPPPSLPVASSAHVSIIADGIAAQAGAGVAASGRFPALLHTATGADVTVRATAGAGYTTASSGSDTFVQAASRIPTDTSTIVIFGGGADLNATPLEVAQAVTRALSAASARAPEATRYVIGPAYTGGANGTSFAALRSALRSGAEIADAVWVDPYSSGWLPEASRSKTSATQLSAADERALAAKLQARLGDLTD